MGLHADPLEQEDQDAIILDARTGDLDSLREIFTALIHPKLILTCQDPETYVTPLHMAAANGHTNVVKYIMDMIKNNVPGQVSDFVNRQNNMGNTALHWASLNGNLDVVRLLCDGFEADPFIKNVFGHDCIFVAENNGVEELEDFFLKKYDIAPSHKESEDGKVLVKEGSEIEQVAKEIEPMRQQKQEKKDGSEQTLAENIKKLDINTA